MSLRVLWVLFLLIAAAIPALAGEYVASSRSSSCWFQCGPTYNPFVGNPFAGQPSRDMEYRDGDHIGGYRGELSPPLPGEYGYRYGEDRDRGHHGHSHH